MLDYINSKLWRKTCCGRCSCWTLSSGTENWLNQRHLEHPKPCEFIASRNHSLVERTESKGNSKAGKARNCSHVQVDFRPYNEEHTTVRNKTFVCLGSRKDCLFYYYISSGVFVILESDRFQDNFTMAFYSFGGVNYWCGATSWAW